MSTPTEKVLALKGAHSALVDAKAQANTIRRATIHTKTGPKANNLWEKGWSQKSNGVERVADILYSKRQKHAARIAETSRPIPDGWIDGTTVGAPSSTAGKYDGPVYGPKDAARTVTTFFELWSLFVPISLLEHASRETNRYGNEDWVKEVDIKSTVDHNLHSSGEDSGNNNTGDSDGDGDGEDDTAADDGDDGAAPRVGRRRRKKLVPCDSYDADKRHRFKGKWRNVTPGFLLAFFSVLIASSALHTRDSRSLWSEEYGAGVSWIQNTISRDAFEQVRAYFHLVDNSKLPPSPATQTERDTWMYRKVSPWVKHFGKVFREHYTIGWKVAVDESMIRYNSKRCGYLQYMPKKPVSPLSPLPPLRHHISQALFAIEVICPIGVGACAGVDITLCVQVCRMICICRLRWESNALRYAAL
jgi:hypothetical protein